ncbi:MAG: RlmE family RNA methyltransferase [Desulfamplus sp.]|nr:RlmE family RNA methyltransferase [Desulfamplus sp.]
MPKQDKINNKSKKEKVNTKEFNKGKQQWADHLTEKAKHDNYPARSVYKLMEIQKKFNILKKGDNILDLGCAPGSWLLYASQLIRVDKKIAIELDNIAVIGLGLDKGIAIGVDLQKVEIKLPSNAQAVQGNILNLNDLTVPNIVKKYDVVLSDMAPSTTGRKDVDAARSFELCEAALKVTCEWLTTGGNFVCKIFQGAEFKQFEQNVKTKFKQTSVFKPESCRSSSKEIYIIGKGKI